MTLPFVARNKVLFIIMGFADHPMSNNSVLTASYFLPAKVMQNNFRKFEELVFCDFCGFRIPDSRFRILDSGFRFPGFRVALFSANL